MANANDRDCRDYVPLLTTPQVPTDGTGSTAELHDEIIKFCYAYIDNFRCCTNGKKQVVSMNLELEKLREIIEEGKLITGFSGTTAIVLEPRAIVIPYEYYRYLQEHGRPEHGIYKAELLDKYLQEKADLGIVE